MFTDRLLAGRKILVTGGGTGLGKAMAAKLGFNETQLINYALAKLREDVLPTLPEDAPELSAKAMKAIRARHGHLEAEYKPTSSLIQGL